MPRERFKITNADGTPKLCKFCGEPVWWDVIGTRWYNVGTEAEANVEAARRFRREARKCLERADTLEAGERGEP